MTHAADMPAWAALLTAFFLLAGSALTLAGSVGLVRLKKFYERLHPPTLGSTGGVIAIVIAFTLFFSVLRSTPVLQALLIVVFVTVTTPVTFMLLGRAALFRDRTEGDGDVPPPLSRKDEDRPTGQD